MLNDDERIDAPSARVSLHSALIIMARPCLKSLALSTPRHAHPVQASSRIATSELPMVGELRGKNRLWDISNMWMSDQPISAEARGAGQPHSNCGDESRPSLDSREPICGLNPTFATRHERPHPELPDAENVRCRLIEVVDSRSRNAPLSPLKWMGDRRNLKRHEPWWSGL